MKSLKTWFKALIIFIQFIFITSYFLFEHYLPRTSGIQEVITPSDASTIERGEYLARNVVMCIDCHSQKDWSRFSGPYREWTLGQGGERFDKKRGYFSTVYAANITPSNLKHYSDADIFKMIVEGLRPNGSVLHPSMPYSFFRSLTYDDVLAIISFIRTLPESTYKLPENKIKFPYNFLNRTLPLPYKSQKQPTENPIDRGHYLAKISGCIDCHTQKNAPLLSGGRSFILPNGTIIKSQNLTPNDYSGIGAIGKKEFIKLFKQYEQNVSYASIEMKDNTVMPWSSFSGMSVSDLSDIYDYLRSVPAVTHNVRTR